MIEQILPIKVPSMIDMVNSNFGADFHFISLFHNICHHDTGYGIHIYKTTTKAIYDPYINVLGISLNNRQTMANSYTKYHKHTYIER